MQEKIALANTRQLVFTEEGYLLPEDIHERYTLGQAPNLATIDPDTRQFSFAPARKITRRFVQEDGIRVETDVFGLFALPHHKVWAYDPVQDRAVVATLAELEGSAIQMMGVFPMPTGNCPGYFTGTGAWYRAPIEDFVFDFETESGLIFTRTLTREAGVWSGEPRYAV